jgi:hypothetical protein
VSDQLDVLKLVATRLDAASIPYMVTGSIAASHYATPRFTRDIDVVLELVPADAERVSQLFEPEFYSDLDALKRAARQRGMVNLIHRELLVKVDFIVRKDSPYRIEEFRRRRSVPIEDVTVSIVAPEDLVLSKLVWMKDSQSEVQRRDVKSLLRSVRDLDQAHAKKVAKRSRRADTVAGDPSMSEPITDTTPEAEALYRELLMNRSGEERVRMACDMFQAARRLILAALPVEIASNPAERRIALLLRTYEGDLENSLLTRVISDLRSHATTSR